ncbi:unnamed protein product [Bursaphelenchus okinawaensis]|uniref:Centromere/kinetochore protein zw10 homolog n=1 Tax=Bursaphelenchus okinawaensis TaxID=465554 RepID=A0A811K3X0_9BILA|nr:unnamed protein product [Bursaphelenchus okinawaensis]CAG9091755.1 unnamed protein product [Bursaphelenchus okinawaensis]
MFNVQDVFSMSNNAREKEIAILEKTIEESTDEVKKLAGDNFLYLNNILKSCSDADTGKKLQKLDDLISKIQKQVTDTSKKVEVASVKDKITVIKGIEKRLEKFAELRNAIRSLNTDFATLESYRSYAMKLKNMKGYKDIVTLEEYELDQDYPEEEIMTKFIAEVNLEIERFNRYLEGIFDTFIVITKDVDNLNKTVLTINSEDPKLICDCLDSLNLLERFDDKFRELATVIWTDFCEVLLNSADSENVVTITSDEPHKKTFISESKPKKGEKQNVQALMRALENFFENLHDVLKDIKLQEWLVTLIGREIGNRVIETLLLRSAAATVSLKKTDEEKLEALKEMIKHFDMKMRELHFFDDKLSAEMVLNKSNRLFVNQRCRAFLAAARNLIAKPYVDLVEVSGSLKPSTADINNLTISLNNMKIKTEVDEEESVYEMQKCKVSDSVYKLVPRIKTLFDLAMETEDEMGAVNFFQAALLIIDTFLVSTPRLHQQALLSVPQTSAIFYNNCQYLFYNLSIFKMEMEKKLPSQSNIKREDLNFTKQFKELRTTAMKFLEHQLNTIKASLLKVRDENMTLEDLFVNIDATPSNRERVEKTLNGSLMELSKIRSVWSDVMSDSVLEISLGVLVSHLLSLVTKTILSKEDITVHDAESMARLCKYVLERSAALMTINGVQAIHRVCQKEYYRLKEIVFVLEANLDEIGNRWCDGIGILAEYVKPFEVRGLVCALFQNTSKRASLLDQIRNR